MPNIFNKSWKYWPLAISLAIAFLIIVIRRPDVLLAPQFWAEDGAVWYAEAYKNGVLSLFTTHTGYFQTMSRLTAVLATTFFSLASGPLFYNLMAISIRILPVGFIFSGRCDKFIPNIKTKIALAAIYLLLPNTYEVNANITNAHWFLSLLSFLILVSGPARAWVGKIFDSIMLLIGSLSGPFVIFLLPILFLIHVKRPEFKKDKTYLFYSVVVIISALIQIISIATNFSSRSPMTLGASVGSFIKIISGQIFIGAILGKNGFAWIYNILSTRPDVLAWIFYCLVFASGLAVVSYASLKSPLELQLFILFSALIIASSLYSPMTSTTEPQWTVMTVPGAATRYWVLPMIAFNVCLLWLLRKNNHRPTQYARVAVLLFMLAGVHWDFFYPQWQYFDFTTRAQQCEAQASGTKCTLPIQPTGWNMVLIKK